MCTDTELFQIYGLSDFFDNNDFKIVDIVGKEYQAESILARLDKQCMKMKIQSVENHGKSVIDSG